MEQITPLQFWSGVIIALIPQVFSLIIKLKELRAAAPQVKATSEVTMSEGWQRLFDNYQKQIDSMEVLQKENAEFRKLPLILAVMEQEMKQCKEDKEDWKKYSIRLADQLKEHNLVPYPFRRTPQDGDTQDKIATVQYPPAPVESKDPNVLQTVEPIKDVKE